MTRSEVLGPWWPTFGASAYRVLLVAAVRLPRTGVAIVGTDDLVRHVVAWRTTETRRLVAAAPELEHAVPYAIRPTLDNDGAPVAPVTAHTEEVEATLREVAWQRMRGARGPEQSRPLWTSGLRAALQEALAETARNGAVRAGAAHLVVAAFADPANRAVRKYPRSYRRIADGIRQWSALTVNGEPYPELEMPAAPRSVRRRLVRDDPLLSAVTFEQLRQAVRLGHTTVTACHVLVAMLDVEYRFVALGLRAPGEIGERNTAARRLRQVGVTYGVACDWARQAGDDGLGESHQFGDPLVSEAVTAAARTAEELALSYRHPAAGTTHLLAGLLTAAERELAGLLAGIGADPVELDHLVHEDLSSIEPDRTV